MVRENIDDANCSVANTHKECPHQVESGDFIELELDFDFEFESSERARARARAS